MADISAVEASRAWERMNEDSSVSWCQIAIASTATPKAFIKAYGNTNLAGLKENLSQSDVEFVLLKVSLLFGDPPIILPPSFPVSSRLGLTTFIFHHIPFRAIQLILCIYRSSERTLTEAPAPHVQSWSS